ncbi:DNA-binding pseudobarrel domain-containing protein [Tanacetum coccineum]
MQSYKQFKLTWYHFSIEWPSFRRSNNISKGDECVFKYIRCEDKMCLVKVTKRKTQARSSPPAAVAIETEVDDGLDDKDTEDNNDKDEDEDADFDDDDDPFFVVTLTQHNFKGCLLRMPVDFVRSAGIGTKKTITLKNLDGYEKEMPVRVETKYHYQAKCYYLRKGWTDFARSNNISVGDKCVFKFITSEDKLCLAKITKALPTQVDDDDVEVDSGMDDKDADKDVELVDGVDGGDPFFVVTISTIHKAMLVRFKIALFFS